LIALHICLHLRHERERNTIFRGTGLSMLDSKFAGSRGASRKQPDGPSSAVDGEVLFTQELVMAVIRHYWLLLLGPIAVALLAYAITAAIAPKYVSTAFLRIDRAMARSLEGIMSSPGEADKVLAKYPETGNNPEARVRYLSENMWLTDLEPQADRQIVRLFRLEVAHWDPQAAQAINSQMIDTWLETTVPPPRERANLQADLDRNQVAAAANTALIEQLQKEATTLVTPNSMAGEIATPISTLIAKRDQTLSVIATLRNKLGGLTRDVIVTPPHLPREPSLPRRKAIAALSGLVSIPAFLILILLGRHFAPGLSPRDVLARRSTRRPA
jgi:hypothetical protein